MKKILVLTIVLCMLIVSPVSVFAYEVKTNEEIAFSVDLYSFDLESKVNSFALAENKQMKLINEQNAENYKKARKLLEEIPFGSYELVGAKEYFLDELDRYEKEGLLLEKQYSISISPMSEEYWGVYEGIPMRAVKSNSYTSYTLEKKGLSFGDWVKGVVDFAMNWVPFKSIGIPYSIVGNIQPEYEASTNDRVLFISREDRETRVVYCQDVYEIYGPSSQYIGQIGDEHVVADVYITTIPASPYIPVVTELSVGLTHIYTTNYTNTNKIKEEAYNNYMMGRNLITRHIPRAKLILE